MQLRDLILEKRKALREMIDSGEYPAIAQIKLDIRTKYDALVLINKAGLRPFHVFEVGTSSPSVTSCRDEILNQIQESAILKIIPNDDLAPRKFSLLDVRVEVINALHDVWGKYNWVNIFGCAIGDGNPTQISVAGHSTFVGDISSPCIANNASDKITHKQEIQTVEFSELDDGTIDVLLVDLEGNEWLVLKNMISKPPIIQLETHTLNGEMPEKEYINPFIDEITVWMEKNGYIIHALTQSDTIFINQRLEQFLNESKYIIP